MNPRLIYTLSDKDIAIGNRCERGSQLRPNVVWFSETVSEFALAQKVVKQAGFFLIIGTSSSVYPAASLVGNVKRQTSVYLVSPEVENVPCGCNWFQELASFRVPLLVNEWINKKT